MELRISSAAPQAAVTDILRGRAPAAEAESPSACISPKKATPVIVPITKKSWGKTTHFPSVSICGCQDEGCATELSTEETENISTVAIPGACNSPGLE